jgi:LysM repeat protein
MSRHYLRIFIFLLSISEIALAKSIVDCRVATGKITECNPYGKKLHYVKKVVYDNDRLKLIIVKTLPTPEKKHFVKVISVAEMIEKYIKVEDSKRFTGNDTESVKITVVEVPLDKEIVDKKIEKMELSKEENIEPIVVPEMQKPEDNYGYYVVVKGDVLSRIAKKFGLKVKTLVKLNGLKNKSSLHINQKLKIPFEQKMIDSLASATYKVEEGDTLISIAKKFKLLSKDIVTYNHIKDATTVRAGKVLKLPLPYFLAQIKAKKKRAAQRAKNGRFDINAFGKHKLRVTATAYTSHGKQTDSTPFLAAWNNRLRPGMKSIAVSRDLLTRYGMRNGTKVRISGLRGYYRVRDKMNKRYRKRIDIYMGVNRRKALRWGRRSVVIYF